MKRNDDESNTPIMADFVASAIIDTHAKETNAYMSNARRAAIGHDEVGLLSSWMNVRIWNLLSKMSPLLQ